MSLLIDATIKVSLIVLCALAGTLLLRRRSAATRHWMLAAAIACAAAAPLLQPIAPSWTVQVGNLPALQAIAQPKTTAGNEKSQVSLSGRPEGPRYADDTRISGRFADATRLSGREGGEAMRLIGVIWIAGVVFNALLLIVGLGRLGWLASRAQRLVPAKWADLADDIARSSGVDRPIQLLQTSHPSLPVTWGFARPKVLLPSAASEWTEDRMRVVLLHEIAHIRRGDWMTQMAAECLKAAYWFNPLVWVISRRLRQESEHACDDAVLNEGVDGQEYAVHLLTLARSICRERLPFSGFPAPAMARPSSLERRFTAMLNDRVNRTPLTRSTRAVTTMGVLAITLLVAGFGVAQTFATFSGTALDPTNRLLPGVTVFLTNVQSQAKYQVQTDRTGRFEFVGLPPGDYAWETGLAGFATLKGELTVSGRDVQQDLALQVGSLEETITVRSGPSGDSSSTMPERLSEAVRRLESLRVRLENTRECSNSSDPIGGQIKAPAHAVRVNPRYPENLSAANIGGVVVLSAVIGTDGNVRDVTVLRAPHPDLAAAAVDALQQWQFTATLLNCEPVEVNITVTANFVAE